MRCRALGVLPLAAGAAGPWCHREAWEADGGRAGLWHLLAGNAGVHCTYHRAPRTGPAALGRRNGPVPSVACTQGRGWSSTSVTAFLFSRLAPCPGTAARVPGVRSPGSSVASDLGPLWQVACVPGGHRSGWSDHAVGTGMCGAHRGGALGGRSGRPGCIDGSCFGSSSGPEAMRHLYAGR